MRAGDLYLSLSGMGLRDRDHIAALPTTNILQTSNSLTSVAAVVTNSPHSVWPLGGHSARTITYYGDGIRGKSLR